MAREPKKGKFRYNLASVLKVRNIRETQEKERFAETQRILETEKQKEETLKNQYHSAQNVLREHFEQGKNIDFSMVFLRQNQIENLKIKVDDQKQVTKKAEQKNEEQRVRLVQSIKDKKIIEKDKDNKFKDWVQMMNKEEMKFIDDIATIRFNDTKE